MNNLLLFLLAGALLPAAAHAQATAVPAPAAPTTTAPAAAPPAKEAAILPNGAVPPPVPTATPATAGTARFASAPETPAANPNAIKVRAEANPATGRLTVKTDNPGPTRIELSDAGGRPVLTYTMMNGQAPAVLNVSRLPAGSYIVRCTAYEKTGMRRVMLGQ